MSKLEFIVPDWPAPKPVHAAVSTRGGGVSAEPFDSLNCANHVGDDPARVDRNRALLRAALALPDEPRWLRQVHGVNIVDAADVDVGEEADGSFTRRRGVVCAVLTADCLPLLLCSRSGKAAGILHCGWRGLAQGIVERGVRAIGGAPDELLAWLGPSIGPKTYEVGHEVRDAMRARSDAYADAFRPNGPDKWRCDLYALARLALQALGVTAVYGGGWCTHGERERFFSFRRDGRCGRMASLIWLA